MKIKKENFFGTIKKIEGEAYSPRIYRYLSLIKKNNFTFSGTGISIDESKAILASMGEAVERYCANIIQKEEIDKNATLLNVNEVTRATQKYDFIKEREWVLVKELKTEKIYQAPLEMVYLTKTNYEPLRDIISTGLASYSSIEGAIERGVYECIERDAFVLFWMLSHVNFQLDISSSSDPEIKILQKKIMLSGLNVKIFDISTEFGVKVIMTVLNRNGNKGFYISCAADINTNTAIKKSITEGLGGYAIYTEAPLLYKKNIPNNLKEIKDLEERPLYYLHHDTEDILEKILSRNSNAYKVVDINDTYEESFDTFEEVINKLYEHNYKIYYKDLTTKDVRKLGFSVVRVLIPKLTFLPVNKPMIISERLNKLSKEYKRKLNMEEHPFP
ncbi:hypothetical protein HMPREF2767_02690 [Nosocomiicoccus sp. HMSC067E10]|nr:hypothetical protein HMPREF2767_02690 [Nosocomiicoccus sp. HMSC067E10]